MDGVSGQRRGGGGSDRGRCTVVGSSKYLKLIPLIWFYLKRSLFWYFDEKRFPSAGRVCHRLP